MLTLRFAVVAALAAVAAAELPSNADGPLATCLATCGQQECAAGVGAECDTSRELCASRCLGYGGVVDDREDPCAMPTEQQCFQRCMSLPKPPTGSNVFFQQCLATCPPAVVPTEEASGNKYTQCLNNCMDMPCPPKGDCFKLKQACYAGCDGHQGADDSAKNANDADDAKRYEMCIDGCMDVECAEGDSKCQQEKDSCEADCDAYLNPSRPSLGGAFAGESEKECEQACYDRPCPPEGCAVILRTCLARCRNEPQPQPQPQPQPPQTRAECEKACDNMPCPPEGCNILKRKCYAKCEELPAVEERAAADADDADSAREAECIDQCEHISCPGQGCSVVIQHCIEDCKEGAAPAPPPSTPLEKCIHDCEYGPCPNPWGCETSTRNCIIACKEGNQNIVAEERAVAAPAQCTRASCENVCYSLFCLYDCAPIRASCLARCPDQ